MAERTSTGGAPGPALSEDFEDFFATSLNGLLTASPDGTILRANPRFTDWLALAPDQVIGRRFTEFLSVAGRVYYETHLAPLLRMQGSFDEIALDLVRDGGARLPVLATALERRDDRGNPLFLRITVFKAEHRRRYEKNLLEARSQATAANAQLRELNALLGERAASEARERLRIEGSLSDERQIAALREQFIAVLGHDLRNPLAAIAGGLRVLMKQGLSDRGEQIATLMEKSVARMTALIDNVLDFARGRLGSGIAIDPQPTLLEPYLQQIVEELRNASPGQEITTDFKLTDPVDCDPDRLSQLVSNLVANAITHGAPTEPVRVTAATEDGMLRVAVMNTGTPVPAEARDRLFEPFTRHDIRPSQQGLGLGLYIVSEIAKAHSGKVEVTSTPAETKFEFTMTVRAPILGPK